MIKRLTLSALTAACLAAPGFAADLANGEDIVSKRCKACHTISDGDNVILKGGRIGPNLFGVVGRQAGTLEGFNYGDDIVAAGEKGLVWSAEEITAYLENPRNYLRDYLGDKGARSKMSFRLKPEDDRADVAAYLAGM